MANHNIDHAREIYNIQHWSDGCFDINDQGQLVVCTKPGVSIEGIPLQELIQAMLQQGLSLPILVRFNNILHQRVKALQTAFQQAMEQYARATTTTTRNSPARAKGVGLASAIQDRGRDRG